MFCLKIVFKWCIIKQEIYTILRGLMITEISKLTPGEVKFNGMVDVVRDKKNMQFVVVKDYSGKIQLFVDKVEYPEVGDVFSHLVPGATVLVEGELVANEHVKLGGREVLVKKVLQTSHAEVSPIAEDSSIDQRLDYRWIDLRTDKNLLLFKVQTSFTNACREFLIERNCIEIHSPQLIGTA